MSYTIKLAAATGGLVLTLFLFPSNPISSGISRSSVYSGESPISRAPESAPARGWAAQLAENPEESSPMEQKMTRTKRLLTPEERRILLDRGTEPPHRGDYVKPDRTGMYVCQQCGIPLFSTKSQFRSECGWPSFDDALPGAVERRPDPDGRRTEIVCAACGGHLGHVFEGERFTPRDTRYCVNSLSLDFYPGDGVEIPEIEEAYFAGGCFWGVETFLEKVPGVLTAESGYMGGHVAHPTYEQVCTGRTGHAETVRVVFDPRRVTYETLARTFFEIHDPTQVNRQGPDIGHQYRSVVFTTSEAQRQTALGLIRRLKEKGYAVVTEIEPAGDFTPAESHHQNYYDQTGKTPYCHAPVRRFD